MLSAACRFCVGLAIWMSQITPAGAQYPDDEREIAENVIYRFGRHIFVPSASMDVSPSETPLLADAAPPPLADDLGEAVTTGAGSDLLSDIVE